MEEMISKIKIIKDKASSLQDEFAKKFQIREEEIPVSIFGMIYNNASLAYDLVSYYDELISTSRLNKDKISKKEFKKQMNERIIGVTKFSLFISILSSIEHGIRRYSFENGYIKKLKTPFSEIVKNSNKISENDKKIWEDIIYLRNRCVHHNAISGSDKVIFIPESHTLELKKDSMIKSGRLDIFIDATSWALDNYKVWCENIEKEKE